MNAYTLKLKMDFDHTYTEANALLNTILVNLRFVNPLWQSEQEKLFFPKLKKLRIKVKSLSELITNNLKHFDFKFEIIILQGLYKSYLFFFKKSFSYHRLWNQFFEKILIEIFDIMNTYIEIDKGLVNMYNEVLNYLLNLRQTLVEFELKTADSWIGMLDHFNDQNRKMVKKISEKKKLPPGIERKIFDLLSGESNKEMATLSLRF